MYSLFDKAAPMLGIWREMHPFWSAVAAAVIAQLLKPIIEYFHSGKWNWRLVTVAGGMPSSHSALACALALSIGIQEQFRSSIFAVAAALAIIVVYDAANVRFYSGQTAKVTQELIQDLQKKYPQEFNDPIYETKLKSVLGHRWREVFAGCLLGMAVAILCNRIF